MSESTIDLTSSVAQAKQEPVQAAYAPNEAKSPETVTVIPDRISAPTVVNSQRMGREIWADYNEINILETDESKSAKLEMWIAKNVGEYVANHYPNRQWRVDVDLAGGVLALICPSVSSTKGYHIHLDKPLQDICLRAKMAAGEILERYGLSRARAFNPDVLETLPCSVRDEVKSADAAPEPLNGKKY